MTSENKRERTRVSRFARDMLHVMPEACLLVSGPGEVLAANPAAQRLLGVPADQLQGSSLFEWLDEGGERARQFLQTCARTRSMLPGALSFRVAGNTRMLRCEGALLQPASSDAPSCILIRLQLRQSASRTFVLLNQKIQELSEEVRRRSRTEQELREAHTRLERQHQELESTTAHMEEVTEELTRVNRELWERTREAELARQSAEEANRAKAEFLATMSHELRTPLNAISGYTELIAIGIHGPVTEAQQEALNRIQRNQQRLLSLINHILNFAKLEAGQVKFSFTKIPLDAMLQELQVLIEPQFHARQLRYTYSQCTGEVSVWADREKVEQILLNLLSNAIKFTEPGGEIRVEVQVDEAMARVSVLDTGQGIAPERLPEIFDPFVQVDSRRIGEGQGVGLGLSISRELAREMGGDVTAESTLQRGSVFTLSLPLHTPTQEATLPSPAAEQ